MKMQALGIRVKTLREIKGLSFAELANLAGCHENTIRGIEAGEKNHTIGTLESIAVALGVELIDLIRAKNGNGKARS